jgi:hypothetical protein
MREKVKKVLPPPDPLYTVSHPLQLPAEFVGTEIAAAAGLFAIEDEWVIAPPPEAHQILALGIWPVPEYLVLEICFLGKVVWSGWLGRPLN